MNETILLELRLKLAEAQRDLAIAEKNLATFLATHSTYKPNSVESKTGLMPIMLKELQQHESLTTDVLAQRCNTTPQTMRVILHRAKKKGLVIPAKTNGFHEFKVWSVAQKGILENSYLA